MCEDHKEKCETRMEKNMIYRFYLNEKQTNKAISLITRGDGNRYEVRITNIYLPRDVNHSA